ncbi:MAG TPA: methyltransferase domain-containing protein [Acidimicrobiales bacterium]|nr:methyltransferase domain-containing protein [Acidimicrobiales bacterium]
MVSERIRPLVARGRQALSRLAAASPAARRLMARAGDELVNAASGAYEADHMYGASYFGCGRDPSGDRAGLSGYATYDRISSNAEIAGYLLWRTFGGASRTLDVGCATGLVVEVLRELGVDALGCDLSAYAVAHATPGARGHVQVADLLAGLPWGDGAFDVVSALETLEHMPPEQIPTVLKELRRVCAGFVYSTIPSFGMNNGSGPDGHFEGKVLPERLAHYQSLGADYFGPVPFDDLARDASGEPVEGHLTIAAYGWWTERFYDAGFERRPDVEARIYADIEPAGLAPFWNIYVFSVPGAKEELAVGRSPGRSLVELGLHHPLYAG